MVRYWRSLFRNQSPKDPPTWKRSKCFKWTKNCWVLKERYYWTW